MSDSDQDRREGRAPAARERSDAAEVRAILARDAEALRDVAALHVAALSYRSFITHLGVEFLAEIYRSLLKTGNGLLFGAYSDGRLIGFVLGTLSTGALFKAAWNSKFRLAWLGVPRLLIRPRIVIKILETALYSSRLEGTPPAELVAIAVDEQIRSMGLGARLVEELQSAFRCRGVTDYKVTVHSAMTRSCHFYERLGMALIRTFQFAGTDWSVYCKSLSPMP